MASSTLDLIFDMMREKKYDAIYLSISNENLYEFTELEHNLVYHISNFTGDTGSMLIFRDKAILYVDGRFVIQAKNEIVDKRISIVKINRAEKIYNDIVIRLKSHMRFAFNPKLESAKTILSLMDKGKNKKIKFILDTNLVNETLIKDSKFIDENNVAEQKLFILDKKYVTLNSKTKISKLMREINNLGFKYYLTSSLEEIAYLTNLRKKPVNLYDEKILCEAFLLVSSNKSRIYIKEEVDKNILSYLNRNGIEVFAYDDFYKDMTKFIKYNKKSVCFDINLNNYYIYKKICKNTIVSPLLIQMSIKGDKEIAALKMCNVVDGVAITKAVYDIKNRVISDERLTEYEAKCIVDKYRYKVGKNNFLSPSFSTIVAYKDNSAICHYNPLKDNSVKLSKKSLLLIDSGGNYTFGTTDITRTISLYKDKSKIPKIIKFHYTLVLNAMLRLAMLRFPYGLTGTEIDIIARQNLYKYGLDFNHGTGHGIGFISNVHEGPNNISPGIRKNDNILNVLEPNQVCSDEPGLYFENKYGIRLENDLLVKFDRETSFGTFLRFDILTLCPFDRDLIDEKVLDKDVILFLNGYNKLLRKKLYGKLNVNERKKLLYDTIDFKI